MNIALPTAVDEELCDSVVESCSRWVGTAGGPAMILGKGISSFVIPKQKSLKEVDDHKISYIKMGSDILCDIDLF